MLYTPTVVEYIECVICPYCSGVYRVCYMPLLWWSIWSVLYAHIVVEYIECVICPYCSGVYGA